MKDLVSVIVLLDDVEAYINESLGSILDQTYKNIEILLISKGVKDNTLKICEYYAKKDKRIRLINIDARTSVNPKNVGIKEAKAKYITFIEAGDIISLDYIEYMYKKITENDADIVCVGTYKNGSMIKARASYSTYKGDNILTHYFHMDLCTECYGKLFKKSLFKDIEYPDNLFDDLTTTYKLYDKAEKVINSTLSKYAIETQKTNPREKLSDRELMKKIDVTFDMLSFIELNYPKLANYCKIKICYQAIDLFKEVKDKTYKKQLYSYIKLFSRYALNDKRFPLSKKMPCIRTIYGYGLFDLSMNLEKIIK